MLVYKKGDVLNSGEPVVVHGCNCKNAMGAGIARQVRAECPVAYRTDQATLWGDKTKLGTFTYGGPEANGMMVFNAYTQYNYTRTEVDVDYKAVETSISSICEFVLKDYLLCEADMPRPRLAMPKIGCGCAKGDWKIVSEILERISEKYDMEIRVYEL